MRPRTLLALFAVVAGLGGFIWLFERDLPSTDERVEQSKKLLRLDDESVRAVTLISGERRVRLERAVGSRADDGSATATVGSEGGATEAGSAKPTEWLLTQPLNGRADADEVAALLASAASLEKRRTLDDGSRAELGLDSEPTAVLFETEAGEVSLRFGSRVPASSYVIVELGEGPPFYVVSDALVADIGRPADSWRSRDAIPAEASEIEAIEILQPENGVVLERSDGGFQLVRPLRDAADEDRVADFVEALVGLEIEEFADDAGGFGDRVPASVRLTVSGVADPLLVEVERTSDDLALVRVGEETFKARTDLVSWIERPPAEWRSRKWTASSVFEIESFEIRRERSEALRLERRQGGWYRDDEETKYSTVSSFLRAITKAAGTPLESGSSAPSGAPTIEIDLDSEAGRETLRLWSAGDGYLAERAGRAAILKLEADSSAAFFSNLDNLEEASAAVGESEQAPTESRAESD